MCSTTEKFVVLVPLSIGNKKYYRHYIIEDIISLSHKINFSFLIQVLRIGLKTIFKQILKHSPRKIHQSYVKL